MIHGTGNDSRAVRSLTITAGLAIAGGGIAGVCAAITAARAGAKVALVQDRPVLGGNASSEVRLWMLGATSHMGNNNRWAREGGVMNEIMVENLYRNPEGNVLILDTILLEKVRNEPNITLLLNTAVNEVEKSGPSIISAIIGYCPQNETRYRIEAPLFCDASGDGVVGFMAGAAFRMGAESREEFGEGFASSEEYGQLLGHSLYFYSKDAGRPVRFIPPSFALRDIATIPHYRDIRASDYGCRFWWFEWGGRMDTVHDTEDIKWELWKVAYGVWDYIKNSGQFPDAANLTLEWVGTIPGKRESRRFEGDYMLCQSDIMEQRRHDDAVSFGGWAIDLHPADGVYSPLPSCTQWHSKGVYQIPYRALYSRNIDNLFITGRLISATHVAFGSTRTMATCGHNGQAVGMAAAICAEQHVKPRDLLDPGQTRELQLRLMRAGQYIPGLALQDPADLARRAAVNSSSRFILDKLAPDGQTIPLDASRAMLLPVSAGPLPAVAFLVDVREPTVLELEVRGTSRPGNHTPDVVLHRDALSLPSGAGQRVWIRPTARATVPGYHFYCLLRNPAASVHTSPERVTGVLSVSHAVNKAVATHARQDPPPGIGIDSFEFWLPSRRPGGRNLAIEIDPPLDLFGAENIRNGVARPVDRPNAWVAAKDDPAPKLTVCWTESRRIARIDLTFDADYDHPMESVLMGHPEREMPFCVKRYRIVDGHGNVLYRCDENHQTLNSIRLDPPAEASTVQIEVLETHGAPAAIFEARFYEI